ncbi:kelch-like protein 23 [Corythoichthys intestinalis]|uniref:kelch-like protein 23 n=1 Tax=Corythoichthys intestinalis TaxID=161448 RepID=UPI0025A4FED5|nr:kelch-like protein 23 [Corythoichthys intestinalis]XP_061799596.1 kelch-like protein 23 [Nerophis lumbriciformis]
MERSNHKRQSLRSIHGQKKDIMSHQQIEAYTYEFCDPDHPVELLDALRCFYFNRLFTDVILQCADDSGQMFHCHKALLSARSAYFQIMFTADMKERSNSVIKLAGVDCEVLAILIDYVYTAQVSITEKNVQSLLEAADLLQFVSVKRACERFLVRLLDVDNCLGMHAFAKLHVCPRLEREASRVIQSRFAELIRQEEFLELDPNRIRTLLDAQMLSVPRDEVLIDAVAKWVIHDLENRIHHAVDLLRSIHLDLEESDFKTTSELYRQCLEGGNERFKSMIKQGSKLKSKAIAGGKTNMYIIGGYYWHPLCEVHIWEPTSDTWLRGKDMPDNARESYSVASQGADIYVTGGYRTNTVEALDTVFIYNCDYDEWTEGCPMITARYYHCSVALHGCIYAIGGYRGGAPEQETEFYDPLKKEWFSGARMIQGVGNATACVMGDKIYVTGGHYGFRGSCTYEKIQVYRPDISEWSIITISPHPEYGLCSVSLENKLYLVGGQTTIADCFDTQRGEWSSISVMKERRMECSAAVINGCIYVTGGYSYSKGTYLQSIEKYDPQLDTWEIVGVLPSPSRSHGCVCVYSV